ncbi:PLP-dependent cysteine synthase family protein [Parahaliea aestuarii]|uniref:L-cysteine desulfhydrase Cds1 n=1 Tax=Parahaliea aestuarii TaxID=1852021 RepID=A0A5C8ZNF0_9GAMM|nr:PLP-dependent cysteine synthase family protein [Parahaliea aestuarii]TXS90023.1 PLP-dependent cysteine synthase family protein [Parahaliea aestuarii]
MSKPWINRAIAIIEADIQRSSDTHLLKVELPAVEHVSLYLKDESTHPTGSLKHRLARSLFLYGLCNGLIQEDTPIIEASSGSTAISEAYFAQLLGLPFIAVIPRGTSQEKIDKITFYNGQCHLVEAKDIYAESARLADELGGHYMDQFTYAERATDWRGNNNIAESIYAQMALEPLPVPAWIVVGAGTGGTSATIGRFIRYKCHPTRLCVADPEHSVFFDYFHSGDRSLVSQQGSRIEGIGRPRVEPSFVASVIDEMIKVPDAASYATIHFLEKLLNRRCGGSTGTNLYAAFQLISRLNAEGRKASVVSMICDSGERYLNTYYNPQWLADNGFEIAPYQRQLDDFYTTGLLAPL